MITLRAPKNGVMRVKSHFYNNLDRHDNELIGLYDQGIVWSFPGFVIIITRDFFLFFFWRNPSFVIWKFNCCF